MNLGQGKDATWSQYMSEPPEVRSRRMGSVQKPKTQTYLTCTLLVAQVVHIACLQSGEGVICTAFKP